MNDKFLTEILTQLLKNQREQQAEIDRLSHIVTVLRAGATPEQEKKIDEFLRAKIVQAGPSEHSQPETIHKLERLLQQLETWAEDGE